MISMNGQDVVRATLYYKDLKDQDPATKETETRRVFLGWGLGDAGDGYFVVGSPYQLFDQPWDRTVLEDVPVLIRQERWDVSMPRDAETVSTFAQLGIDEDGGDVHFKYPNI